MPKIYLSDSVTGGSHADIIVEAILANNPSISEDDITVQLNQSYNINLVLNDMLVAAVRGYDLFVCSAGVSKQRMLSLSEDLLQPYPSTRFVFPHGLNTHVEVPYNPDKRYPAIGCGASNGADNETSYGNALWFFDDDNGRGTPASQDLSSFSTGVIAGKLLFVKDSRGGSWWDAIYACMQTASGNGTATLNNGYGIINVESAIEYDGVAPESEFNPYIPQTSSGVTMPKHFSPLRGIRIGSRYF
jgi:hypothetical protein